MVDLGYEGEVTIVTFVDEDGKEIHYEPDLEINYDGKRFAILVELPSEDCEPGCKCHEEPQAIVTRIDTEDGEDVYIDPTEEEFEAVLAIYEDSFDEE